MESSRDDFVIAIRSAFLKKGTQQRFSLISLIFFSIIFLILGNLNFKAIDYVKIIVKDIVYRSSFIVSEPEKFILNSYDKFLDHFNHYEEYQNLKDNLKVLKSKDLSNEIVILENIKYRKLIDDYFIKESETYAKVLIDNPSPFLRSIIINKGSKNNIKLGMIILDEGYLVGNVVEVNYLTSRVLLISDINSKIPVSIEPGDVQAIMSGKSKQKGTLLYTKNNKIKSNEQDLRVITSGAGRVFKSGIPIGKIKYDINNLYIDKKIVDFYSDFSQLKYVKVVSYTKEQNILDSSSKKNNKDVEDKILQLNQRKENIKILIEEKKIASEIRIKYEEENNYLENKVINLQRQLEASTNINKKNKIDKEELKFLRLNLLYGKKCAKNFYNKLYKVGSVKYRECVLSKGTKKN